MLKLRKNEREHYFVTGSKKKEKKKRAKVEEGRWYDCTPLRKEI